MSTTFCLQYQGLADLELSFLFRYLFVALHVDVKRSMDDDENRFNQLSIEERGIWLIFYGFFHQK
jgi:hypothetical protein